MESRKHPPVEVQVNLLIEQDNRCLYCGHSFGDLVVRQYNDWQWLEIHWDHFVPYSYLQANPDENWVAACHLCNMYKGDQIFQDVREVRCYIIEQAARHRHDPPPFWTEESTVTKQEGPTYLYDNAGFPLLENEDDEVFGFRERARVRRF